MADRTTRTPKKKGAASTKKRRWPGRIAKAIGLVALLGIVASALFVVIGYRSTDIPDPNADFSTNTSFVYYRDGTTQLGSFSVQNRQSVDYDQMSPNIKEAMVAAENRSFWTDPGFSVRGMARAAWTIARGGNLQGGSTITQQYIKIYYLNSDQNLTRKVKEVFLAAKIGRTVPKEQILTDYLNTIYYGRGAYGIQAASKAYFKVDAKDLTVQQAAVLASVVNNPSLFDPSVDDGNAERLLGRYQYVLQGMAEAGAITPEEAATDGAKLPKFPEVPINQRYAGPQGFLLKMTERELVAAGVSEAEINGGGLKIVTTFDKASQDAAVQAARSNVKESADAADAKAADLHVAIASVDVGTGEVRATYGGPNYIKNSRNWATTPRPTASTFKTFALAAALENGYSLRSVFNGDTFTPPGDSTPVRNEASHQYGPVSLLRATADSINTAFVDLTTQLDDGVGKVDKEAQDAGAPSNDTWPDDPRNLVLGAGEVSPLDMANAYATYGNGGMRADAHVIKQVSDENDQVIYRAAADEKRAVSADVATDVTFALTDVVEQGTGTAVQTIDRPVAAKTGTKDGDDDDIVSAWFVGYTKQISTAVMYVAGDAGTSDLDDYKRPSDFTFFGGTYPAQTWADYMEVASDGMPVEQFDEPAYVNRDAAPQTSAPTRTREPSPETRTPTASETPTQEPTPSDEPTATETRSSEPPTQEPSTEAPTTRPPTTEPPTTAPPTREPTTAPPTQQPTQPTRGPTQSSRPTATAGGGGVPGGGASGDGAPGSGGGG